MNTFLAFLLRLFTMLAFLLRPFTMFTITLAEIFETWLNMYSNCIHSCI